jgi:hypothetical protein
MAHRIVTPGNGHCGSKKRKQSWFRWFPNGDGEYMFLSRCGYMYPNWTTNGASLVQRLLKNYTSFEIEPLSNDCVFLCEGDIYRIYLEELVGYMGKSFLISHELQQYA